MRIIGWVRGWGVRIGSASVKFRCQRTAMIPASKTRSVAWRGSGGGV